MGSRTLQTVDMDKRPLTSILGGLVNAMVPAVNHLQQMMLAESYMFSDLLVALDACNKALLSMDRFLAPAYVTSTTGVRFSDEYCAAIAKTTGNVTPDLLVTLAHSLMACLCSVEEPGRDSDYRAEPSGSPAFSSTLLSTQVLQVLNRVLMIARFLLKHMQFRCQAATYIDLLHDLDFFPVCCTILSACTNDFQTHVAGGPRLLSTHDMLLSAALLGSALWEYHCALRRSLATVITDTTTITRGDPAARARNTTVWGQLHVSVCQGTLFNVTQLLTRVVDSDAFYSGLSPIHKSLLSPSLGLEHLVRANA